MTTTTTTTFVQRILSAIFVVTAAAAALVTSSPAATALLPPGTLSHFCVVTSWDGYNTTLQQYATLFGVPVPSQGIAGGPTSNGTYENAPLVTTTKIAFLPLNNNTRMEFLAGDPSLPSWWRDVYLVKG
jgi:hypothetical protein